MQQHHVFPQHGRIAHRISNLGSAQKSHGVLACRHAPVAQKVAIEEVIRRIRIDDGAHRFRHRKARHTDAIFLRKQQTDRLEQQDPLVAARVVQVQLGDDLLFGHRAAMQQQVRKPQVHHRQQLKHARAAREDLIVVILDLEQRSFPLGIKSGASSGRLCR